MRFSEVLFKYSLNISLTFLKVKYLINVLPFASLTEVAVAHRLAVVTVVYNLVEEEMMENHYHSLKLEIEINLKMKLKLI